MAFLKIKIKLLSPVILSSDVEDSNLTGTLDYIPATSILGLFAAKYIHKAQLKEAHLDDKFNNWFLKEALIFTNAYISEKEEYDEVDMLPTPLCLKKEKKGEKIFNVLLNDVDEQLKSTPSYSYIYGNTIKTREPEKKINFHHTRDRLTGHTKDEGMFNYEVLLPDQVFKGKIYGEPETLKTFKETFKETFFARLGKSRNAEYGRVKIVLSEIEKTETRILEVEDFEDQEPVLLTLISPCILLNEYGFSDPSLSCLEYYLRKIWGKDSFKITNCILKTTSIENYISVWRMKRPLETAIVAGSTIKLYFKENLSYEEVNNGLLYLVEQGIGERRGEGFGRVKVNMAMAKEYYEKEVNITFKKPTGEVPEEVKKIFISIIQEIFKEDTELRAYRDADDFTKLPSSSLLGKLGLILSNLQEYDFKVIIDDLRDKAKTQIKGCRNKKYTLYEYIKEFDEKEVVNSIYNRNSDYLKLAKLVKYNLEKDKKFLSELWRIYFAVLFKRMRQKQQFSGKEELSK